MRRHGAQWPIWSGRRQAPAFHASDRPAEAGLGGGMIWVSIIVLLMVLAGVDLGAALMMRRGRPKGKGGRPRTRPGARGGSSSSPVRRRWSSVRARP